MDIATAKTAGAAAVDIETSTPVSDLTQNVIDQGYMIESVAVIVSKVVDSATNRFKIRYTAFDAALSADVFAALKKATDDKITDHNTQLAAIDTAIKAEVAIQPIEG